MFVVFVVLRERMLVNVVEKGLEMEGGIGIPVWRVVHSYLQFESYTE